MPRRSMDLSAHTSLAGLAEAVGVVHDAASRLGLALYVAGAFARDLWLAFGSGVDTGRKTEDVDFAVQCADWSAFDRLARELAARRVVRPNPRILQRFRHPNGTEIDLIPFGGIEAPDRTLVWPPDGDRVMNLLGFSEVLAVTSLVRLPGGVEVQVVSLHALALLKLLAWEDRRTGHGDKDAGDLYLIGRHYLAARRPNIPEEEEADLLERHDFDEKLAGAELLGRDMAAVSAVGIRQAVGGILRSETDADGALRLARALVPSAYDAGATVPFIVALRSGFEARAT